MKNETSFKKNKLYTIVCSDGPCKGLITKVVINTRKCLIPLHSNHAYKAAIYLVTTATDATNNYIAVFSHAVKR